MDQLHLMTVFVAVAEEHGFAAGARKLKMSAPAVTRAVSALEDKLGTKLLNRTTRQVKITDVGSRYYADAKRIISDIDAANNAAIGINKTPKGLLTVTAPALFGRMFVMPTINQYLTKYPETEIDAVFLDRIVNLLDEGIDVGVRIGELPDSSMRALRVGKVRMVLCASPDYLHHHGIPQTPNELQHHSMIQSRPLSAGTDWLFEHKQQPIHTRIKPRLAVTTNDAAIEAALAGFGITRLLSYQIAPYLESGQLKTILEPYEPATKPIHIVHRENHLTTAKVRAFIDMIAENLRANKALN